MSVNPRISKTINNYYCNSIGFDGGGNTYLYVGVNPVVRVDESGEFGLNILSFSRKDIIIKNLSGYMWELQSNPSANGSKPFYEISAFSKVQEYDSYIIIASGRYAINPNVLRAIMYMETTHGYYDAPFDLLGINKSILPMNINVEYWGDTFGSRSELSDPYKNILAGADLIHRIQKNMRYPYSIDQLATLYNNINAHKINNYGARVKNIYYNKSWQ